MEENQLRFEDQSSYLANENVTPRKLWDIVTDIQEGYYQKPIHQRDFVWGEQKQRGWIERIRSKTSPVGVILTYQLRPKPKITYLNDGWQRIQTTIRFLENPLKYGEKDENAKLLVKACEIPVQHLVYNNEIEALRDFQYVNIGTVLTPYECFKGILTYMSSFEVVWEPFFHRLHKIIPTWANNLLSAQSKNRITNRETRHRGYRDDYALFLRFISGKERITAKYDLPKILRFSDIENENLIERTLRKKLEIYGIDRAEKELNLLEELVIRETRMIEQIYKELGLEEQGLTITLYRWLIHVAIFKRVNRIDSGLWEDFLSKLFSYTQGGATLVNPHDPRGKIVLQLGNIDRLGGVCKIIKSSFVEGRGKRKRNRSLRKGFDNSHITPFSQIGNGPTKPEISIRNRSRGAKPIHEDR